MDLLCNEDIVENTTKAGKKMTVQGNGYTPAVNHKSRVPGYKQYAWFSKYTITNIFSLKNLIKKY